MLSIANKPIMLSVMLSVVMLSVVMLRVVMLSVVMLSVVVLNVVAPNGLCKYYSTNRIFVVQRKLQTLQLLETEIIYGSLLKLPSLMAWVCQIEIE